MLRHVGNLPVRDKHFIIRSDDACAELLLVSAAMDLLRKNGSARTTAGSRKIMVTITNEVAGFTKAEKEKPYQGKGLFRNILQALQKSRQHAARRVIINYAHLLPEGIKPVDLLPFISSDCTQSGDGEAHGLGNPSTISPRS